MWQSLPCPWQSLPCPCQSVLPQLYRGVTNSSISSCMDVTEGCGKPDTVYHGEETVQVNCSLLSPCLVGSTALVNCFKFFLVFSILDCCSFFYSPPSSGFHCSLASSLPSCIAKGCLKLSNVLLSLLLHVRRYTALSLEDLSNRMTFTRILMLGCQEAYYHKRQKLFES